MENQSPDYDKYKDIQIVLGDYCMKSKTSIVVTVTSVDTEKEEVSFITKHSGFSQRKTLHWARKNLIKIT